MKKNHSSVIRCFPWRLRDFLKISLFLAIFIFFYSLLGVVFHLFFQPGKNLLDAVFPYIFNFGMLFAINKIFLSNYRLDIHNLWEKHPPLRLIFILILIQTLAIALYLFSPFLFFMPNILSFLPEIFSLLPLLPPFVWTLLKFRILPRLFSLSFLSDSFLSIIVGPFWEEIFFRGILQNYLTQKTIYWLAIPLCSLIFAVFHLSINSGLDIGFYNAFWGSLFTGYFYYRTRSLSLAFILHAANNFSIVLLRLFT